MISKNFEFLKDYHKYKWVYEKISIIEDSLLSDDKYTLQVDSAKLLEKLLKQVMNEEERIKKTLGELINNFNLFYKLKKSDALPSNILASFKLLNSIRSEGVHHNDLSYVEYQLSFTSKVNFILTLRKILHFIIYSFEDTKINLPDCDDDIYYNTCKLAKNLKDKKDFDYENNQIITEKLSIGDFVLNNKIRFFIPTYQRDYRWTKEECEELIEQLFDKKDSNEQIYFGTMACRMFPNKVGNFTKEVRLMDGQQRVTTSLILFKAIFDVIKDKQKEMDDFSESIPTELTDLFDYKINDLHSDALIKIKYENSTSTSENNIYSLYKVLTGYNIASKFKNDLKLLTRSQVITNYEYFYSVFKNYTIEKNLDIYNYYANNFIVSCIRFNDDDINEMEVFENLNSKGKDLDTFDMLKNYIYNMVDQKVFKENSKRVVDEYNKYFNLSLVPKFKGKEDEQNKKYEAFFFNFLTYKIALKGTTNIDLKQNKKSLLKAFKKFYNEKNITFDKYASICSEIGRYFYIYKNVKLVKDYENITSEFYKFRTTLSNIDDKDFSICLFYLFDVFSDNSWSSAERKLHLFNEQLLEKCLFQIERWFIMLLQVKGTGQSLKGAVMIKLVRYLKLFENYSNFKQDLPQHLQEWFSGKTKITKENEHLLIPLENKLPSKDVAIDSLKNRDVQNNYMKVIFLKRLENYWLNLSTKACQEVIFKVSTVEHIMPKTPNQEWWEMLNEKENLNRQELKDKHAAFLNRIGNLLLLDSKNNSELSNSPFKIKVNNYIASDSRLAKIPFTNKNESLVDIDHFDFKMIDDRSAKLAKILVNDIYEIE